MRKRLTDRFLATLKPPPNGRLEVTDDSGAGLVFRMSSDGACSWAVRYSIAGKQKRVTLGRYVQADPKVGMTLASARKKAAEITASAKEGTDLPDKEARQRAEAEQAAKRPQTVESLLRRYVDAYCKQNQRKWLETERMFENHVYPVIGRLPLSDLRRADIVALLDHLQNDKGFTAQVNRVRSNLIAAFNWAIEREYLDANPAAAVKRRKIEKPRNRTLSDAELISIWQAADKLPYPSGPYLKTLILTGQRRDEVRCMTWDEIRHAALAGCRDGAQAAGGMAWVIPGERNKSKRDHIVPVSGLFESLLADLPRLSDAATAPVFTSNGQKPYAGTRRLKEIIDRESGVTGWVFHDIRRTVRTNFAILGVSREVAERVLNHATPSLEGTYNTHEYWPEKRDALQRWADRLSMMVEGELRNVVRLRSIPNA